MKKIFLLIGINIICNHANSQGCSDAGVCTIGNFYAKQLLIKPGQKNKNEIDLAFNYGAHLKDERFYQLQTNYRLIKSNGSFFEFRLPFNIAKNTSSGISVIGIGDMVTTYNSRFSIAKTKHIDYSMGFRISFSNADRSDGKSMYSYPMTLQTGLGTTDLIAAASYNICRYLSIGTGIQVPLLQYNKNSIPLYSLGAVVVSGDGYRRKPDALLKLTGHYSTGKIKLNGGLLGIFHLTDDYYNTVYGKYTLANSNGTTINWNFDISYPITKKIMINFLYAAPLKTRSNIPDGLARSKISSAKITYAF